MCVEKSGHDLYMALFNDTDASAFFSHSSTGVLLMGGTSAHHPAGTQQVNPERVGS